jgi:LEA14-like dessication related protein
MTNLRRSFALLFLPLCLLLLSACAAFQTNLEKPTVKVTALRLLPSQGLDQRIGVDLTIANPNAQDLSLRGISYTIGIENFSVLSGVTDQVPVLKGYQETPVSLVVSANVLQFVRLIEHFSRAGMQDSVNYNFDAKLDFSALLPAMRVKETGSIPLVQKTQP